MTISNKLLVALLLSLIIPSVLISVISISSYRESSVKNFETNTASELRQVTRGVNWMFQGVADNVSYLAATTEVVSVGDSLEKYLGKEAKPMTPHLNSPSEAGIFKLFTSFAETHKNLSYIYMGTESGGYVQWPEGSPTKNYDPRIRPWYEKAVSAGEQIARTKAYYWEPDDTVIVSTVKSVMKDGKRAGVIGMDLSLKTLTDVLREITFGETGFVLLVEDDGTILVDPRQPENGFKNIEDILEYKGLFKNLSGTTELELNGENYLAVSVSDSQSGWRFIGFQSEKEILVEATSVANIIMISLVALIIFFGLFAIYQARYISNPIITVSTKLEEISQGDADLTNNLTVAGRDETAKLSESFNSFLSMIRQLVIEISNNAHNVLDKADLTKSKAAGTKNQANQQIEMLDQLATAFHQMVATAHEVARSCTNAANSAQQAQDSANQGESVISNSVSSVNILGDNIRSVTTLVEELDQESQNISSIVDSISDIADQTNLLALNAAIEAARAGDMGRGFAVVAEEVRNLAQRTQQSTLEIAEQLSKISSLGSDIVSSMEESSAHSENAVANVREAQASFEGVSQAISLINSMNIQIAAAAEEQHLVSEDINRNVERVRDSANSVASMSEESSVLSNELSDYSDELKQLVSRFKT